eukprot:548708_1
MRIGLRNTNKYVDNPYDQQSDLKNKWKNQQISKAISHKRHLGIYYRIKQNKTWKHKLKKRRRSKRRNLQNLSQITEYKQYSLEIEEVYDQYSYNNDIQSNRVLMEINNVNNNKYHIDTFELNKFIKTNQNKIRQNKRKRNKIMNDKFNDFEIYWNTMQQDIKSNVNLVRKKKKYIGNKQKRKFLQNCIQKIRYFQQYVIEMDIECLIKDQWINKLNKYPFKIVYTTDIKTKRNINHSSDKYNEYDIKQILKYDPILKHCDYDLLISGYFKNNKHRQIPQDIMVLCILYCGVISSLLPFKFVSQCDFGEYHYLRNTEINNVSVLPFEESENIYICFLLLDEDNDGEQYRYNNIIPLFKINQVKSPKTMEFHGFGFKGSKFKKMSVIERNINLKNKEYICSLSGKIMSDPVRGPLIYVGYAYKTDPKWYEKKEIERYVECHGRSPNGGSVDPRLDFVCGGECCGPTYFWSASRNHSAKKYKQEIDGYKEFKTNSQQLIFELFCELFCR